MKPVVVLDKSFLQGSPPDCIRRLCADYCVIMPGALFWELLTCSDPIRARSYAKFPIKANPVALVEHVGVLLRYESQTRTPAIPLYARRKRMTFRFHAGVAAGGFQLTSPQRRGLVVWRREFARECDFHAEACMTTHRWFPGVVGASGRARRSGLEAVREAVATDHKMIRELYRTIRHRGMPFHTEIDPRWTHFRWMQVHLLATLRHISTHGLAKRPRDRQELEHDVLDMQYQIMGILAGRIATMDENIATVVSALAPNSMVLRRSAQASPIGHAPAR